MLHSLLKASKKENFLCIQNTAILTRHISVDGPYKAWDKSRTLVTDMTLS